MFVLSARSMRFKAIRSKETSNACSHLGGAGVLAITEYFMISYLKTISSL